MVILGGTNDLGWNVPAPTIVHNLSRMYEQAIRANIQPVAVTVPSIRIGGIEVSPSTDANESIGEEELHMIRSHIDRRLELNQLIKRHASHIGIPCVDLFTKSMEEGTQRLAEEFSNDGLHLSTEGYKLFADVLWEQIFQAHYGRQ